MSSYTFGGAAEEGISPILATIAVNMMTNVAVHDD